MGLPALKESLKHQACFTRLTWAKLQASLKAQSSQPSNWLSLPTAHAGDALGLGSSRSCALGTNFKRFFSRFG